MKILTRTLKEIFSFVTGKPPDGTDAGEGEEHATQSDEGHRMETGPRIQGTVLSVWPPSSVSQTILYLGFKCHWISMAYLVFHKCSNNINVHEFLKITGWHIT